MEILPCPSQEFFNGTNNLWKTESMEDDPKSGRLWTSTTDANIEKVLLQIACDIEKLLLYPVNMEESP